MSGLKLFCVIFAVVTAAKTAVSAPRASKLSVTGYGSLEVAMVRHGEKYATNRRCYAWEDVPPRYHGLTHVRGLNDKNGKVWYYYL